MESDTLTERDSLFEKVLNSVQRDLMAESVVSDREVWGFIDNSILRECKDMELPLSTKLTLRQNLFNRIRRMDILEPLLHDESITEIMVNGTNEIFVERAGRIEGSGVRFTDNERIMDIIGQIASGVNRSVNIVSPILDARLMDGSRVNIVVEPIALDGPVITIRRFPTNPLTIQNLITRESISVEAVEFLKRAVSARYNIIISGGTGAGKTTFLNIMSSFIAPDERIITIEDSAELQIRSIANLVRLESRPQNAEGENGVSIRDLIRCALRMRPDRIIVGEVRGEEAIDMLQALNVGQDGSLSTIHANSAKDALTRLETMIMMHTDISVSALKRQIASGVEILVHLGRLRDKSRHVLEIVEVLGMENGEIKTHPLFEYAESGEDENGKVKGALEKRDDLIRTEKMRAAGISDDISTL